MLRPARRERRPRVVSRGMPRPQVRAPHQTLVYRFAQGASNSQFQHTTGADGERGLPSLSRSNVAVTNQDPHALGASSAYCKILERRQLV